MYFNDDTAKQFRFWCQKVLPLVYDDSLSYYELLCKVVKKLNEMIEEIGEIPELIYTELSKITGVNVDTVTELVKLDVVAGSYVATKGYYEVSDGGACMYYITDDYNEVMRADYYIELDVKNRWAIPIILSKDITVKWFGAYGDNSHDDTRAIVAGYAYAKKIKGHLQIPEGTYVVSNTLILDGNIDVTMEGSVHYVGEGIGVLVGNELTRQEALNIKLKVIGDGATKANSVGIELRNCNGCYFEIDCSDFETGVLCHGYNYGFNDNIVMLGLVNFHKNHIVLTNTNNGWCNENLFIGGRMGTSSQAGFSSTAITIDSKNGYKNNGNYFLKPNIERSTIGVHIKSGNYNNFEKLRLEAVTTPLIIDEGCVNNNVKGSFGSDIACPPLNDVISGNMTYAQRTKGNSILIPIQAVYNDTRGCIRDMFCLTSGSVSRHGTGFAGITASDGEVTIPVARYIGVQVLLNGNDHGTFTFEPVFKTGHCRLFMLFYNDNGQITQPPYCLPETQAAPITLAGFNGYYFANRGRFVFSPPTGTTRMILAMYNTTPFTIKGVKIDANVPFSIKEHGLEMNTVPTSPGLGGEIVYDATGTHLGWIPVDGAWVAK